MQNYSIPEKEALGLQDDSAEAEVHEIGLRLFGSLVELDEYDFGLGPTDMNRQGQRVADMRFHGSFDTAFLQGQNLPQRGQRGEARKTVELEKMLFHRAKGRRKAVVAHALQGPVEEQQSLDQQQQQQQQD